MKQTNDKSPSVLDRLFIPSAAPTLCTKPLRTCVMSITQTIEKKSRNDTTRLMVNFSLQLSVISVCLELPQRTCISTKWMIFDTTRSFNSLSKPWSPNLKNVLWCQTTWINPSNKKKHRVSICCFSVYFIFLFFFLLACSSELAVYRTWLLWGIFLLIPPDSIFLPSSTFFFTMLLF